MHKRITKTRERVNVGTNTRTDIILNYIIWEDYVGAKTEAEADPTHIDWVWLISMSKNHTPTWFLEYLYTEHTNSKLVCATDTSINTTREEHTHNSNGKTWVVDRLIRLAQDLPLLEVELEYVAYDGIFSDNTNEFVTQMRRTLKADLSYPIIISAEGIVMDGDHRIARAMLENKKTILAKRFLVTPACDYTE